MAIITDPDGNAIILHKLMFHCESGGEKLAAMHGSVPCVESDVTFIFTPRQRDPAAPPRAYCAERVRWFITSRVMPHTSAPMRCVR